MDSLERVEELPSLRSHSRLPMDLAEPTEEEVQSLFAVDQEQAGYLARFWNLMQQPERDIEAINLVVDILNIQPLLTYRERLRPKNYHELLRTMTLEVFEKGTPLIVTR
jgi:hypothetical protein